MKERRDWKVDRVTANHSLSSTACQGTSNIPFPCFLVLGCNRQAQEIHNHWRLRDTRQTSSAKRLLNEKKKSKGKINMRFERLSGFSLPLLGLQIWKSELVSGESKGVTSC